jgi:hypothetical protein
MNTDNKFLIRDKYSKAILNTNVAEVKEYQIKKRNMGKVIELENEVQNLKNELKEIKNLLINRN